MSDNPFVIKRKKKSVLPSASPSSVIKPKLTITKQSDVTAEEIPLIADTPVKLKKSTLDSSPRSTSKELEAAFDSLKVKRTKPVATANLSGAKILGQGLSSNVPKPSRAKDPDFVMREKRNSAQIANPTNDFTRVYVISLANLVIMEVHSRTEEHARYRADDLMHEHFDNPKFKGYYIRELVLDHPEIPERMIEAKITDGYEDCRCRNCSGKRSW